MTFTQRSPVQRVQMHGVSNRDTHLYPPHNNPSFYLTITTYVRRTGRITNGKRTWVAEPFSKWGAQVHVKKI